MGSTSTFRAANRATLHFLGTSPEGHRGEDRFVPAETERRMAAFCLACLDTTATQAYTVFDLFCFCGGGSEARSGCERDDMAPRSAACGAAGSRDGLSGSGAGAGGVWVGAR